MKLRSPQWQGRAEENPDQSIVIIFNSGANRNRKARSQSCLLAFGHLRQYRFEKKRLCLYLEKTWQWSYLNKSSKIGGRICRSKFKHLCDQWLSIYSPVMQHRSRSNPLPIVRFLFWPTRCREPVMKCSRCLRIRRVRIRLNTRKIRTTITSLRIKNVSSREKIRSNEVLTWWILCPRSSHRRPEQCWWSGLVSSRIDPEAPVSCGRIHSYNDGYLLI